MNRVEQSTPYYCGAACASMTFDKYGTTLLQAAAYELIRTHVAESDSWYCDPDGMVGVLNTSFQPDNLSLNIQSYQSGDVAALLARVLHNLSRLQFPTPILINGGAHWVIVDGMRLTEGGDAGQTFSVSISSIPGPTSPRAATCRWRLHESTYLKPIQYGRRWRDSLVVMSDASQPVVETVDVAPVTLVLSGMSLRGGTFDVFAGTPLRLRQQYWAEAAPPPVLRGAGASKTLEGHGFTGARPPAGGGATFDDIVVHCLDGQPDYVITLLDASRSAELSGFVFVAIDKTTSQLLELTQDMSSVVLIGDEASVAIAKGVWPHATIDVAPGYFWQACEFLRSRFAVVRRIIVDGQEYFILPTRQIVEQLTTSWKGGG